MKHLATDLPGGMEYCSDQRDRCYIRKFDWDKARALRAEGRSYQSIATELGVTYTAVRRVTDPATAKAMDEADARWARSGTCGDCGEPCVPVGHPSLRGPYPRCYFCAMKATRECWWENTDGTLTVRCTMCKQWRDSSEFPPQLRKRYDAGETPHGGTRTCRLCAAAARRLYRATHPEQAEREKTRDRERRRRASAARKALRAQGVGGGDS